MIIWFMGVPWHQPQLSLGKRLLVLLMLGTAAGKEATSPHLADQTAAKLSTQTFPPASSQQPQYLWWEAGEMRVGS